MALLSVIRRWRFRDRMPIREIARRTGLSRNTIRKYLRSGAVEPKFKVPERPSKLDPFAEKLSGWLRIEAGKSRKQRRTVKQMHADLVVLGFDGSYGRVAAFAREWKAQRQYEQQTSGRGTFVPLVFAPGEAFQFDWSEDWAVIGGERVKLQAAHTKLSHSKAFIVRAYPLQTHEMLFDALTQAFRVLGGVPQRGIFDNMKTAVDRVGTGKARQVNARFAAHGQPLSVRARVLQPGRWLGKGSGREERSGCTPPVVAAMPAFADLDALNAWLEAQCIAQWGRDPAWHLAGHHRRGACGSELPSLMPLGRLFDGFVEHTKRVSPTCLVHFERNRYSVPASFANRPVILAGIPRADRRSPPRGRSCASIEDHRALASPAGQTVYDWRHYLAVIQRKPGALRNGAPFTEMPDAFRQLQAHCSSAPAATGRWSRSWPWCCSTMSRRCCARSNWR